MDILEQLEGERVIFLDTETTGLYHFGKKNGNDRILSIGMIELFLVTNSQQNGRYYYTLLNPCGQKITPQASQVNGIKDEDVWGQPTFENECDIFLDFIGDDMLIAFNAKFDIGFINAELKNSGRPPISNDRVFCLYDYLKDGRYNSNSLDAMCRRYDISSRSNKHHNSLEDALIIMKLFFACHDVDIGVYSKNINVHGANTNINLKKIKSETKNKKDKKFTTEMLVVILSIVIVLLSQYFFN